GDGAEVLARSALSATTPMDVPRNLTSEAVPSIDRPSVKLAWGAPDPCERPQGYRIYRSAGTGAFTFLNEVPNGVLNYTDTAVATLPATYTYYVTALFSRGESLESNKSVVTTRSI
ncbi:MAG TPA: fibronectin type III domain-containing protein, partial [Actinomycetota bacterium]|nr:fibronectin type III domain-containing protein [Actinomycetota bacterium]